MGDWPGFNLRGGLAGITGSSKVAEPLAMANFSWRRHTLRPQYCLDTGSSSKFDWWVVHKPIWAGDLPKPTSPPGHSGSVAQRSGSRRGKADTPGSLLVA